MIRCFIVAYWMRGKDGGLLFKISKVLVFYGKKIGDFALATIIKVTSIK